MRITNYAIKLINYSGKCGFNINKAHKGSGSSTYEIDNIASITC